MLEFHSLKEFKNKRIKLNFKEEIEPHEILLDSLAQKKEREIGISEKKFETPLLEKILKGLFLSFVAIFAILFFRVLQIQVVQGEKLSSQADENKFIFRQIRAERGVIYDKDMDQIIFNLPSFDLVCQKNNLPQDEAEKAKILKEISHILEKNSEDLQKEIEENNQPVILISEGLSQENLIALETRIKEFPGFQIENNTIRNYEDGQIFSHIVGYTGKITSDELKNSPDYSILDWVGKIGLEKSYENTLKKNPGELRIERDAQGNIVSKEVVSLPESGNSLVLWLDSALQKKIKEELENKLKEIGTKKAVGIALDPKTGGVLAMVSLPDYDNNLFQKGADSEKLKALLSDHLNLNSLFNRAISGTYLTGSTIKPLIASAALEENIISATKKIYCEGRILIPNQWDPEAPTIKKDWAAHGWTDLKKALAESCDVYFYTIGGGFGDQKGLGPSKMKDYLELFGWNEKTEIDLPGEVEGFIPDKDWKKENWGSNWWDGDTYNLAIGQGFLQISPIEVANSFAAIANGGTLYQPRVVKEIINNNKEVVEEIKPEIIRQNFINSEILQVVREGMRQAVTGVGSPQASAVVLNSLPVKVAAKTGTAELGKDYYNNWVAVFAPYEDPQIVLVILTENVKGVQTAVLPVAKNILEWYFAE